MTEADAASRAAARVIEALHGALAEPARQAEALASALARDSLPGAAGENASRLAAITATLCAEISELIAFARADGAAGGQADASPRHMAEAAIKLARGRAFAKDLELELAIAPDVPETLTLHSAVLRRALSVLTGFAIDTTDQGSVSVALAYADGMLTLAVSDTGHGLSAAQQAAVFTPFSRGGGAGGLGLGLPLLARLTEQAGGSLQLVSGPGEGSVFTLRLPAHAGAVETQSEGAAPWPEDMAAALAARDLSVLAADDNPVLRTQLAALFAGAKIRSTIVSDGAEAVEAATRGAFDVVLLDRRMPVIGGAQAAAMIRAARRQRSGLPILIACQEQVAPEDCGADLHVLKPYEARSLFAALLAAHEKAGGEARKQAFDPDVLAELDRQLGHDVLLDVLKSYMSAADDVQHAIDAALAQGDAARLSQSARDLAGAASGLGFAALTAAAKEMAQAAREDFQPERAANQARALRRLIEATTAQIKSLYPGSAAA